MTNIDNLTEVKKTPDSNVEKIKSYLPGRFISGMLVGAGIMACSMFLPEFRVEKDAEKTIIEAYTIGYIQGIESGLILGFQLRNYLESPEFDKSLEDSTKNNSIYNQNVI